MARFVENSRSENVNSRSIVFFLLVINCNFWLGEGSTSTPPSIVFSSSSETTANHNFSRNSNNKSNALTADELKSYGEIPLPQNYSKFHIPLGESRIINGKPRRERVNVKFSVFIRRFLEINEQTEEILVDSDLGMQWVDWNIVKHVISTNFTTDPLQKYIKLESEFLNRIWKPDVYIDEMSSAGNASILSKLITLKFLLRDPTNLDSGDIVYSSRNTLRLRCPMDFKYFPADTQTCVYHVRSYSYLDDELKLIWSDDAIFLNDPSHANFNLQVDSAIPNPHSDDTHYHVMEKFSKYRVGRYSALEFTIKMRRKLSYHLVLTYLPSVLLILITWLCFLIPSNMIEARIGISMTTVLTLTAMFTSVREQSPTVSYTMAIDIWMVFHIFFVFVALSLFTFIYWMKVTVKRHDKILEKKLTREKEGEICCECHEDENVDTEAETKALKYREKFHWIVTFTKRYAFWAFAFVYFVFLVSYWSWLLIASKHLDWQINPSFNSVPSNDGDNINNQYVYSDQRAPGEDDYYRAVMMMDEETTAYSVENRNLGNVELFETANN